MMLLRECLGQIHYIRDVIHYTYIRYINAYTGIVPGMPRVYTYYFRAFAQKSFRKIASSTFTPKADVAVLVRKHGVKRLHRSNARYFVLCSFTSPFDGPTCTSRNIPDLFVHL